MPKDQFVTLYDSGRDFQKEMTDIVVNAEEFAKILVSRVANYNFNTFYYDENIRIPFMNICLKEKPPSVRHVILYIDLRTFKPR